MNHKRRKAKGKRKKKKPPQVADVLVSQSDTNATRRGQMGTRELITC